MHGPTPVEAPRRLDHPAGKLAPGADCCWIHVSIQDLHSDEAGARYVTELDALEGRVKGHVCYKAEGCSGGDRGQVGCGARGVWATQTRVAVGRAKALP